MADRPAFQLSTLTCIHVPESDIQGIPKTMLTYVINLHTRLNVIRQCVHNYTEHYKTQMVRNANESTRSLTLTVGDYVFLQRQRTGALQKLQNIYAGVFIVHSVDSVCYTTGFVQSLFEYFDI